MQTACRRADCQLRRGNRSIDLQLAWEIEFQAGKLTDADPLVEVLDNYTCRNFSRAYLRHLVMANEILACTLISLHNVHFYLDLVAQARTHIEAGDFAAWSRSWIERYEAGNGGFPV